MKKLLPLVIIAVLTLGFVALAPTGAEAGWYEYWDTVTVDTIATETLGVYVYGLEIIAWDSTETDTLRLYAHSDRAQLGSSYEGYRDNYTGYRIWKKLLPTAPWSDIRGYHPGQKFGCRRIWTWDDSVGVGAITWWGWYEGSVPNAGDSTITVILHGLVRD